MELTLVIAALSATLAMAAPGAVSLNRSFRTIIRDGVETAGPCVECPCKNGSWDSCHCIPLGCCCEDHN